MRCLKCSFDNPDGMKFCGECGARLERACPQCGAASPPSFKFCGQCAAPLSAAHSDLPAAAPTLQARFAGLQHGLPDSLKQQLLNPIEGENRTVTVLFTDMCGSVAAMRNLPPEDAARLIDRLLNAMVDALRRYEGRIDGFLGDGFRAVFGVPQVHESDPERAILAALDVQRAAASLGLQTTAGINTGEVYFGPIGSDLQPQVSVIGTAVNLAARLQGKAAPGEVLAGETTYRRTRRAFEFTPLSLDVKGLDEPITAYRVERALPRPEKARGIEGLDSKLIGRQEELGRLQGALAHLQAGRSGVVALIGEAGLGKSRLVQEMQKSIGAWVYGSVGEHPNTHKWLEGRCLEMTQRAPYGPIIDLFSHLFGWVADEQEDARGRALDSLLSDLRVAGHLSPDRCLEMAPLLARLLSARFGDDRDRRLDGASAEHVRYQTLLAVEDLLIALARRRPLVVVLEDLHWADALSLDLIARLALVIGETERQTDSVGLSIPTSLGPSVSPTPAHPVILLLCIYRPEREHRCWQIAEVAGRRCPDRFTEVRLQALSLEQSRQMIDSLLAIDELPSGVKDLILDRSRGNPFFVEELVRSLIDSEQVYQAEGRWKARAGIESVRVPESVQAVVLSRVDRLEPEAKHTLRAASVIGRLFRPRLLERMASSTGSGSSGTGVGAESEMERALRTLEERRLICRERLLPELEYSFEHVLAQEAVYGSLLKTRRSAIHGQVAQAIEELYAGSLMEQVEQLAYHYDRSEESEKAIEYLIKSGEKAARSYLNREAVRHYERALERMGTASPSGETAVEDAETQRPLPREDLERRVRAHLALGRIYHTIGEHAAAEPHLRAAWEIGTAADVSPKLLARVSYYFSETCYHLSGGAVDRKAIVVLPVLQEAWSRLGPETQSPEGAMILCERWTYNDPAREECQDRLLELLPEVPYVEELLVSYIWACLWLRNRGDDEGARRLVELFRSRAEEQGDWIGVGRAWCSLGWQLASEGRPEEALQAFDRSAEILQQAGAETSLRYPLGSGMLQLLTQQGRYAEAEDRLRRFLALAERDDQPGIAAQLRRFLHKLAIDRALALVRAAIDCEAAAPHRQEALRLVREAPEAERLHMLAGLGHAFRDLGDYERAKALYGESLGLRVKLGDQFPIAQSLEDHGVLATMAGEHERAARLLGATEAQAERLGRALPIAIPEDFQRAVALCRAALGEAAFEAAWAEGRALSLEQAVEYALRTRSGP